MSKKPLNALPITAELEAEDRKLEAVAERLNIPDLRRRPAPKPSNASAAETKEVSFATTLPQYVLKALKIRAAEGQGPIRHQLLKALHESGAVEIDPRDLQVPDRRGRRQEA